MSELEPARTYSNPTATEVLRRLLDERGTEHYDYRAEVWWGGESSGGGGAKYTAYEQTDGLICVEIADLTPEQAIAATLGATDARPTQEESSGTYAPTVEDVLTEMVAKAIERGELTNGAAQTIAEYAAKLRLAEGEDA